MKKALTGMMICAVILLTGCTSGAKNVSKTYEFTDIKRGTLEKTVSSSGTLKPVATVKVLPRMSGKVEQITVDYNDIVHKGEVIAELNTEVLQLQREQQMAQVIKSRANYELQLVNYRSQQALAEKNLISEYELKTGKTTLDIQAAELSAAEANLKSIETEINQYAFITSPIDGIVLERSINEGDTVVASSSGSSTSMFTLAENLEEMQIESWVGELDIASIFQGQSVRFTLESQPGRNFSGVVESKRLMPAVQDNVVSYNVIISVNNKDGSLLPGMTCVVEFIEERNENILLVPNAALRYSPTGLTADEIADRVFNAGLGGMTAEQRTAALAGRERTQTSGTTAPAAAQSGITGLLTGGSTAMPGAMGRGGAPSGQNRNSSATGTVAKTAVTLSAPRPLWYTGDSGKPEVILVQTGISDGSYTEVSAAASDAELEGLQVILRERI
jgi:HlyD family secretion protein